MVNRASEARAYGPAIDALTDAYAPTRLTLQRVAVHVLARARHAATGRFGLVATPGGFGTPAFGSDHAVVRVDGGSLVVERAATTMASVVVDGSTLARLAEAAGVDLDAPFEVGHDTPPLGDVDAPLVVDEAAARAVGTWYAFGWRVLDAVVAEARRPSRVQLWPEHFDAGCDVAVGTGDDRCNLGASPGDGPAGTPYFYVGPWGAGRPGDPAFWNAPFGATMGYEELRAAADPFAAGVAFLRRGLELLA